MTFETRVPKSELTEIKELVNKAKKEAADLLTAIEGDKSTAGLKETLAGFFLVGSLLASGSAQASAKDFDSLVKGLSGISGPKVTVKAESHLQGNQGTFRIKMGPITITGGYRGGDFAKIEAKASVDDKASQDELALYGPIARSMMGHLKGLGSGSALDVLSH
jgi:hypothetical protein